jgi:hypothetical protein
MKSFFSSRVSKLNAFVTLCVLGITTVSLPVMAAPQEACVKTSAGDVVCGTPVPKPLKSNQPGNDETIDTQVHEDGVTAELKSCVKGARNTVSCTFVLKSPRDLTFGVGAVGYAKLVDSAGNEYSSDKVKVGNRTGGAVAVSMTKGATYRAVFNFVDVPASLSQVVLLQIGGNYGHLMKFRNVPIN